MVYIWQISILKEAYMEHWDIYIVDEHHLHTFLVLNLMNNRRSTRSYTGLAIFCVLREVIFTIRTDWFFLLGINFCDFHHWKYPVPSIIDKFSFLLSTVHKYIFSNNTTVCVPYVKPVFHWRIPFRFWTKQTSCNWTDKISWCCIFV